MIFKYLLKYLLTNYLLKYAIHTFINIIMGMDSKWKLHRDSSHIPNSMLHILNILYIFNYI